VVAGSADKIVQPRTFASKDKNTIAGEIVLVVVRGPALVEADDPEILLFEFFESTNEIDHSRDAEMFGRTRTGFYSDGADGGGTALRQDDAVNTGSIGNSKQRAQILRVFHAIER
jgi:hypothetical protein